MSNLKLKTEAASKSSKIKNTGHISYAAGLVFNEETNIA